jgi:hypothetical protein
MIVADNIICLFRLSYLAASWGGKDNDFGLSYDCILSLCLGCPTWQQAGEERTTALDCPSVALTSPSPPSRPAPPRYTSSSMRRYRQNCSIVDPRPHHLDADPDADPNSVFYLMLMRIRIRLFTLRIRIQILALKKDPNP